MKYTKEILENVIPSCKCIADICRHFGVKPATGAQSHISRKIKEFNIDTSHFIGKHWNKGRKFKKKDALEYCFKGSTENSHRLKQKLIRDGYKKNVCEICNINTWLGQDLPLELDHIDSDHYNNELCNLQILCPNCHAIETRKRKSESDGTVDNSVLETEAK